MRTLWRAILILMAVAFLLSGCSSKKSAGQQTAGQLASTESRASIEQLPGDRTALKDALAQTSRVRYQIVIVPDTKGLDKDDYLDQLLAEHKWPEADMLVLVIYAEANHDIRFALGADFFQQKVTVDELLGMTRTHYLPKARSSDPAGGLADLVRAVNQRMN